MTHTVLVVDDSPIVGPQRRDLLQGECYRVLNVLRGEEALDVLKRETVDLIITKALLPGMAGFDLLQRIRQNDQRSKIPIIMHTVLGPPWAYAMGYEVGADEYFVKPLEPPKILAATRGLIERWSQWRKLSG